MVPCRATCRATKRAPTTYDAARRTKLARQCGATCSRGCGGFGSTLPGHRMLCRSTSLNFPSERRRRWLSVYAPLAFQWVPLLVSSRLGLRVIVAPPTPLPWSTAPPLCGVAGGRCRIQYRGAPPKPYVRCHTQCHQSFECGTAFCRYQ